MDRTRPSCRSAANAFCGCAECRQYISADLRAAIDALVERKKAAEELDEGAAVPVINQFIDAELARLPAVADSMPESRGNIRDFDAYLHEVRREM